jgi:hypothetical protein
MSLGSALAARPERDRQLTRRAGAVRILHDDRDLTKPATWPEVFDGLSDERAVQIHAIYDALPYGAWAEYDRRYGRPEETI